MFADTLRQKDRGTNHRLARKVHDHQQEDAYHCILTRLQHESQVHLDHQSRRHLLRQLRLQYKKRRYPEETYEDWVEGKPQKLQKKEKSVKNTVRGQPSDTDEHASTPLQYKDFNDEVYETLSEALHKGRINEEGIAETGAHARDKQGDAPGLHPGQGASDTVSDALRRPTKEISYQAFSEEESDYRLNDEGENGTEQAVLEQWKTELNADRDLTRAIYTVLRAGLDPNIPAEPLSVKEQHVKSIRTLLYLAIMDRKWDLAYKLYSLLIKIQGINKRLIWTLGAEILQGKLDQARASVPTNPLGGARVVRVQLKMLQDFLLWLSTSFSLAYWSIKVNTKHGQAFIGFSKTHAPMYVVTLLWGLLVEKSYSKVRDVLDELLLQPPFSTHGLFHYMLAICCLSENIDLQYISRHFDEITDIMDQDPVTSCFGDLVQDVSLLSSTESITLRMRSNARQAKRLLIECDALGLKYPKGSFLAQLQETIEVVDFLDSRISRESPDALPPGNSYFALKNGSLSVTANSNFAVPKRLLNKLYWKKTRDLWVIHFYSESQPMSCKVCNTRFSPKSLSDLQEHLLKHGINTNNYAAQKVYCMPRKQQKSELDSWPESKQDQFSESEKECEPADDTDSNQADDTQRAIEQDEADLSKKHNALFSATKAPMLAHEDSESFKTSNLKTLKACVLNTNDPQHLPNDKTNGARKLPNTATIYNKEQITARGSQKPSLNESQGDTQACHDQSTIFRDSELSTEESSEDSFAIKVKGPRGKGGLIRYPKSGSHESSSSLYDRLRLLGGNMTQAKNSKQADGFETSFLARTPVHDALFQEDSSVSSESGDEIALQPIRDRGAETLTNEFHSDASSSRQEFDPPGQAFNSFSPDSTFENPDYERDISQNFHDLATQTQDHAYFPDSNNRQNTHSDTHDILDTDHPHLPHSPKVKDDSQYDYTKLEANILRVGEKDTWSDEFEEVSEDERQWWDKFAYSKSS